MLAAIWCCPDNMHHEWKTIMKKASIIFALLVLFLNLAQAQIQKSDENSASTANTPDTLYRIQTYRAAPGHLQEFIDINRTLIKQGFYTGWSERAPFIGRHSQGDHWDGQPVGPGREPSAYRF